jgi:hypothetical protein
MPDTYAGPMDKMGRPRLVKSFQEIAQEAYGQGFSADDYTRKLAQDFSKALYTTTANTAAAGPTGGSGGGLSAIELQNLDAMMTSVLFQKQHLVLFNYLSKVPSLTPYYEWNRRNRYGSGRANAGFAEGGAPQGGTVQFTRNGQYVKYMGVRRGITHQMMLSGQLGGAQVDPVEEENRDGTLELLERIERGVVFGDSNITDQTGAGVNYDGILPQLNRTNPNQIIDMKGNPFTFEAVEDLGYKFASIGYLRDFSNICAFMTGQVLADLSKIKFQADRRDLTGSVLDGYRTGVPLEGHRTNFGYIPFDWSVFLEEVDKGLTVQGAQALQGLPAQNEPGSPAAPAANLFTVTVAADAQSNVPAGTYYYGVSAVNDFGESQATVVGSGGSGSPFAAVVGAGQGVTVTSAGYADATVTQYRVYRGSKSDGTDLQWIGRIPAGSATGLLYAGSTLSTVGGQCKFVDRNWWNPAAKGLVIAFDRSPENIAIAQMTPLLRWPLPIVGTQLQWLLLLYHALVIKAPERIWVFKNIGLVQ